MSFEQYKQLEKDEVAKGHRNLFTTYFFLVLSATFFALFFFNAPELYIVGCAFLCDAAAIVYLFRALSRMYPFRQTTLAQICTRNPSTQTLHALCAGLAISSKPKKLGKISKKVFTEAYIACKNSKDISSDDLQLLQSHINTWGGIQL